MKFPFPLVCGPMALILLAAAGCASPILWTLNGVTLTDGGTVSGTFTFNPDTGTPCGSVSPCGTYSNVNIVTTNGSSRTGVTYSFVCGQSVVSCTGVSPNSTEVLFLTSNVANQAGAPALALFFTGINGLPPRGLTDSGGIHRCQQQQWKCRYRPGGELRRRGLHLTRESGAIFHCGNCFADS
jgi:hypothetical protein